MLGRAGLVPLARRTDFRRRTGYATPREVDPAEKRADVDGKF